MSNLAYYLRISNHLAGKLDIGTALKSVKFEIEQILPLDHLDVCLIDEDKIWNTTYEVGLQTGWGSSRGLIDRSPVRDVLTGKADTMITGNAMEDARYVFPGALSEPIIKYGLKSRVNVSMKVLGRTIGSLNCSSKKVDFYDTKSIKQVRNIADVLAPYFFALRASENARKEAVIRTEMEAREEGLRLGALSLTEALEQERQRIGMDLHDQTLADLTRISRELNPTVSEVDIQRLQLRIQDCIQGLRDIIDTSMPSLLELFGFQHAVRTHLERALAATPTTKYQVIDGTDNAIDQLDDSTRIALFRIVQEAINNAVQHSGATSIEVEITKDPYTGLHLMVRDNGSSLMANVKRKPQGGLTHMRTRARLIAAEFNIINQGGTCIDVRLPVADAANGGELE